ncbi:hypothetical protein [Metabacillus endolithicus]|uniref:Uncharacterized protein n=1 Tax=Metabacillus endolithicus TaxID=1535204 RepID=A0ABW5C3P0_9BACI
MKKTKEKFQEGAQVTADNQIFGTPNSNAKNERDTGTGSLSRCLNMGQ